MNVSVRFFAVFRERLGATRRYDLAPGATVATLWGEIVAQRRDLEPLAAVTRFAVNGTYADRDAPLSDGDEVAVLPPMSGGEDG